MKPSRPLFSNADDYDRLMGRWSAQLAPRFAAFAGVRDGDRVLDVGCGTGSLIHALAGNARTSAIVGIDPVQAFIDHCRSRFPDPRIAFDCGSALALPYPDGGFDRTLSLLVLMFIPEPLKAIHEMRRVTRAGGTVAACTWDRDGIELTALLWEAAERLDPALRAKRAPALAVREGQLAELWRAAGLERVEESTLRMRMDFASFDDYWAPLLGGTSPLGAYIAKLDSDHRDKLRASVRNRLLPGGRDAPFSLDAKALVVRGRVPALTAIGQA